MKKFHLLFVLSILISLMTACGITNLETKTFREFYKGDLNEVAKIKMQNGNTGNERMTADDQKIKNFISDIKDIKFIPDEDQSARDGYYYAITFYEGEEETLTFGLGMVEGHYYHTEPQIKPFADQLYESIRKEKTGDS